MRRSCDQNNTGAGASAWRSKFELKALQFVTSAELLMVMSAAVMLASVMLGISGSTPNATSKLIGYTLNQDDQKN
jgi:hypothetical protein